MLAYHAGARSSTTRTASPAFAAGKNRGHPRVRKVWENLWITSNGPKTHNLYSANHTLKPTSSTCFKCRFPPSEQAFGLLTHRNGRLQ